VPGIGIITNPHSKLNKKRPSTPELLGYILGEHGRLAVTQSLEDLAKVAAKFRDADIEILAINGGDGTISKTLTAFIKAYGEKALPKIALLRGGTMNVLANNLGITGAPPRILFRLCEAYSGDNPLDSVRLRSLDVERSFGFLFADGIAYQLLDEFYLNKSGPLGAAWLVFRIWLSALVQGRLFQRMIVASPRTIEANGEKLSHESLMILAASIERLPFGFRLFPAARQSLQQFQYASVRCAPNLLLRRLISLLLLNQPKNYESKLGGLCSSLSISAKAGYNYSLDGELFTTQKEEIQIRLGPEIEFLKL
jgi:diacylglycerol kinase family enzyme